MTRLRQEATSCQGASLMKGPTPKNHLFRWWVFIFTTLLTARAGEIERLKYCGYRDMCANRSESFVAPPEHMKTKEFTSSPCFCDEKCKEFGDCCEDRPSRFGHVYKISGIPRDEWTCRGVSDDESFYLVTQCKEESRYAKLCSRMTSRYHYVLDLPVYSRKTGISYGNIYCSLCHNDYLNLEPINIKIVCTHDNITHEEIKTKGVYMPGLNLWKVDNETCSIHAVHNLTAQGRKCVPSIAECPKAWNDLVTAEKCNSYQLLIEAQNGMVYKNPHCALCNGMNLTEMKCWRNYHYRKPILSNFFPSPSLSIVMNFKWDFRSCQLPQVFDGLHSECRDLSCHRENSTCPKYENLISTQIERYLTAICLVISITCLLFHTVIYFSLTQKKNLPSKILNCLSISLLFSHFIFLVGVTPVIDISHDVCHGIAIVLHYFFLASFFWMNIMSIDIWRTFSKDYKQSTFRSFLLYSVYAWGTPLVLVVISVLADYSTFIPDKYSPLYAEYQNVCWFASRVGLLIFFYVPIWSLVMVNSVLFFLTLCYFQKQKFELGSTSGRKEYTRFWLYLKLSTIMGLSWGFGMIASLANIPDFWYPFIVLNGLQGAFIFIMFDLKPKIMELIFDKVKCNSLVRKDLIATQSTKVSGTSTPPVSRV